MGNIKNMIAIDGERFKAAFRARAIKPGTASEQMGYSSAYISATANNGRIPVSTTYVIEAMFGISPDEYIIKDDAEEAVKGDAVEMVISDETMRRLQTVIYTAVKDALEGDAK